ncbi:hypothetical protein [Mesorhizobium sp. M0185]|uniref:hypothetical protein n=1 Tax=unclassified Mesorhizobium TaxID=325217 RepID=UPI0033389D1F
MPDGSRRYAALPLPPLHQANTSPSQAFEAVMAVAAAAVMKRHATGYFWRQDRSAISLKRVEAE